MARPGPCRDRQRGIATKSGQMIPFAPDFQPGGAARCGVYRDLNPMYRDQKVVVVMPAYNAAQTLQATYDEVMDQGVVDHVIVVDDASPDETTEIAKTLPHTTVLTHEQNTGYGGNQKSDRKSVV